MNIQEKRLKVTEYEQTRLIYMNFSVDENNKVWALPEGETNQYLMDQERIDSYNEFLDNAIEVYTTLSNFFSNDYKIIDKLNKYKLYKKRLENALKKLNAA